MHDGEKSVLARAALNGLAGRVVAREPPVAHPCSILERICCDNGKTLKIFKQRTLTAVLNNDFSIFMIQSIRENTIQ